MKKLFLALSFILFTFSVNAQATYKFTFEESGDPQGVKLGKTGFTYKDTNTDKIYESLGGTEWRVIESNGISLRKREVNNIPQLKELTDLKKGEGIYVKDREATFEVIQDVKGNYPKITYESGVRQDNFILNTTSLNLDKDFVVGTEVSFKIKILNLGTPYVSPTTAIFKMTVGGTAITFGYRSDEEDYIRFGTFGTDVDLKSVVNEHGDIIANRSTDNLNYNEWYDVTFTSNVVGELTAFKVGEKVNDGQSFLLDNVRVNDETFSYENATGTIITGDLGDELEYTDNLTLETSVLFQEDLRGNDMDVIDIDEVGYFRSLRVIVNDGIITPTMVGYQPYLKPILKNTISANPFIQHCLDSYYDVFIPAGYYYLDEPLIVKNKKRIEFAGSYNSTFKNTQRSAKDSAVLYSYNDVVADANDVPIDYFYLLDSGIEIINCTIDVTHATYDPTIVDYQSPKAFTYFVKGTYINGGKIIASVIDLTDDHTKIKVEDAGYLGVFHNYDTVHPDSPQTVPSAGEIHFLNIYIEGQYIKAPVYLTNEAPYNSIARSSNSCKYYIQSDGCKMAAYTNSIAGRGCYFEIDHQSAYILYGTDEDLPVMYAGSDELEMIIRPHDLGEDDGTYYSNKNSLINDNVKNVLINWRGYDNIIENVPLNNNANKDFNNNNTIIIDKQRDVKNGFISQIEDVLFLANKKYTTSVSSFDNDGTYDFETELDESTTASASLSDGTINTTISNINNLFRYQQINYPKITYHTGFSSANNDFVELVIDGFDTPSELIKMIISFIGSNYPNKVQVILHRGSTPSKVGFINDLTNVNTLTSTSQVVNDYDLIKDFNYSNEPIKKIIVRFIGEQSGVVDNQVKIGRIFGKYDNNYETEKPIITEAGGKIYEDLEVKTLSNSFSLPDISTSDNIFENKNSLNAILANLYQLYNRDNPPSQMYPSIDAAAPYSTDLSIGLWTSVTNTVEAATEDELPAIKLTSTLGGSSFKYGRTLFNGDIGDKAKVTVECKKVGTYDGRIKLWNDVTPVPDKTVVNDGIWHTITFEIELTSTNNVETRFYSTYGDDVAGEILFIRKLSIEKITDKTVTGTVISLDYINGRGYNLDAADTHDAATYTTTNLTDFCKAKCLINTASAAPTITGATLRSSKGDAWVASTDMYMYVEYDGETVEYWFELKI